MNLWSDVDNKLLCQAVDSVTWKGMSDEELLHSVEQIEAQEEIKKLWDVSDSDFKHTVQLLDRQEKERYQPICEDISSDENTDLHVQDRQYMFFFVHRIF